MDSSKGVSNDIPSFFNSDDPITSTISYSERMSAAERISLACPSRIREFAQMLIGFVISPGRANTSRQKSSASCAVISVPDFSAASVTSTHRDIPATISFLIGKL